MAIAEDNIAKNELRFPLRVVEFWNRSKR